jgi:tRNA A-37 threonylcarbamoyl transferase component Bud32
MNHVKILDGKNILIIAVEKWVFERDINRGFMGEALVWGLIFPYLPLINAGYLRYQEVILKRRLILELLENLVLDFPELSHEFQIKPRYFMHEAMLRRIRLFPTATFGWQDSMQGSDKKGGIDCALQGYIVALKELANERLIDYSDGYVRIPSQFIDDSRNPKLRLLNLSRTVPRTLFTSLLGILPRILDVVSQGKETFLGFQDANGKNQIMHQIENPEEYVYVPTTSGLVPLADRTSIETFAKEALCVGKDTNITIEAMGGMLNDVYLIGTSVGNNEERRIVVKRFRDWSSLKWFPLTLWSAGTRAFAVLSRSRLERECSINLFLGSNGLSVPKLLHVSADERLVFMEYVKGENASARIRRFADCRTDNTLKKEQRIIERIGGEIAKVHALGIALGDTKPENIKIGEHDKIYLMDFEQASRKGDRVWDVAEFLYYTGHDLPAQVGTRKVELITEAFIKGYLDAGGDVAVIKKAASPKYTRVFSVFTLPHILMVISNVCSRTREEA